MLERGGFVRLDSLPGEHKGRLEAIVPILGDEGYQNAWTGGKALSLEEALAEATAFEPSAGAVQQGEDKREAPEAAAGLSPRELDVLRLMADGLTNQEIADTLFISSRTVANHAANILGKLGLSTRTGVVAYAIRQGLA
jgi:DNA-binding NarL/FixJ family response regulator